MAARAEHPRIEGVGGSTSEILCGERNSGIETSRSRWYMATAMPNEYAQRIKIPRSGLVHCLSSHRRAGEVHQGAKGWPIRPVMRTFSELNPGVWRGDCFMCFAFEWQKMFQCH